MREKKSEPKSTRSGLKESLLTVAPPIRFAGDSRKSRTSSNTQCGGGKQPCRKCRVGRGKLFSAKLHRAHIGRTFQ